MNIDQIKEILARIPIVPVVVGWTLLQAWNYYGFLSDASSQLTLKATEQAGIEAKITELQTAVQQLENFKKNLEIKKMELRNFTQELQASKSTLSDKLDVADFLKTTTTEAQRVGLRVIGIKPGTSANFEYYSEQAFELTFRGVFLQMLVFFERISNMQKLVRVDNFELKPTMGNTGRYVEIEGIVQIKTFRYLGSKADQVTVETAAPAATPGAAPAAQPGAAGQPAPAPAAKGASS